MAQKLDREALKMAMLDVLIHNATVVTQDDDLGLLSPGMLGVRGERIELVTGGGEGDPPEAGEVIDAQGAILMPGLINAHTHLPMSLFRGLADDLPLEVWLNEHIFPAEARFVTPANVRTGTLLACAELLLGGVTTCCDGYFREGEVARAVAEGGMRAILGQGVIDFPAPGVGDPADNVAHAVDFVTAWQGRDDRITPAIFCHSPYTCGSKTLKAAKTAARELGTPFLIHLAETRGEQGMIPEAEGRSPTQYLDDLGLLDEGTLLVHGVWLDAADIRRVAASGAAMVHCPESNMKLASGVMPLPDLLAAGIPVGLGTDGAASNNDLDLFGELDMAAKLHKAVRLDPTVASAPAVLAMATNLGARVLGMADRIGSLTPGKLADLVLVETRSPRLTPIYDPISHLVYTARGGDVRDVMVGGRWAVRERRLLTFDSAPVMAAARAVATQIQAPG
jgi:5-methylthioadenosine/S-adenosylhomocysteine deaminase